jgi:hypothetical protein
VQLVEISMLKAYASRPMNAEVAPGAATGTPAASVAVVAAQPLPVAANGPRATAEARIIELEERLEAQEMVMEDVWMAVFGGKG